MAILAALAGAIVLTTAGQVRAQKASADSINTERVLRHVKRLTEDIGPRPAGSAAARKAATYIYAQLRRLGLAAERIPVGVVHAPSVEVGPIKFQRARRLQYTDPNILVRFTPSTSNAGKALLLMAHYDTVTGAPGAVDNAASVGILLELARVVARKAPPRPVFIAFTAAEEVGLGGARRLAMDLGKRVGLAVSLDLLGISDTVTLNGLSTTMGVAWLNLLAAIAHNAKVPVRAPLPHRLVSRMLPQLERSDHGAFTEKGIPAFHIYNREIYLPYHTAWDSREHLRRGSIDNAGAFVVELTRFVGPLPEPGGDPGFWIPFSDKPRVIRAITVRVLSLALVLFAIVTIIMMVRARTKTETKTKTKGLGLAIAVPAYALGWLLVSLILELDERLTLHPMPWAHAPMRYMLASVALAGTAGFAAAWLATTRWAFVGTSRYLISAIVAALLPGMALLFIGAHEIAWIPLVAAAALSGMHWSQSRWAANIWLVVATVPVLVPLGPEFLREAVFHGFLRASIPLALLPGLLLLYPTLAVLYVVRRFGPPAATAHFTRQATAATLVTIAVISILAIVMVQPPCEPSIYAAYGLSCEIVPH